MKKSMTESMPNVTFQFFNSPNTLPNFFFVHLNFL
jgi:hypothetical protein